MKGDVSVFVLIHGPNIPGSLDFEYRMKKGKGYFAKSIHW